MRRVWTLSFTFCQSNLRRHIHVHTWRYNNTHLTQTAALQQLLHPGWKHRGYIMGDGKGNSLWGRLLLKDHFFSFFNLMTRGRVRTKERLFRFFTREKLNIQIWSLTQLSFISVRDRQSSRMISFQKTYCNTHRTYLCFFKASRRCIDGNLQHVVHGPPAAQWVIKCYTKTSVALRRKEHSESPECIAERKSEQRFT